ncbi:unnamed protein product [Ixodes pacificus]
MKRRSTKHVFRRNDRDPLLFIHAARQRSFYARTSRSCNLVPICTLREQGTATAHT